MSDWFARYGIIGIYFMVLSIAWFLPFYPTEQYLFNWSDVPGHDAGRLKDYLEQNFGVTWVRQADFKKIDNESIILSTGYLFSWNETFENDSLRLIKFLKQNYSVSWVRTGLIQSNGTSISLSDGNKSVVLSLNKEKTMVTLIIDNVTTDEFIVKNESGKLNIYSIDNYLLLRLNNDKSKVNLIINDGPTDEFSVNNENVYFEQAPWDKWDDEKVKIIVAILAALVTISLPAGYILSIFSQTVYYDFLPESMQVHKTVIKDVQDEFGSNSKYTKFIKEIAKNQNEPRLEPIFGKIIRLDVPKENLEKYKWVQNSVEKRWDVLSINSAMIIATALAPLFAFIIGYLFSSHLKFGVLLIFTLLFIVLLIFLLISPLIFLLRLPLLLWFNDFFILKYYFIMIFFSSVIMIILFWNRQILFNQIVEIYKILLIKIIKQQNTTDIAYR